MFIYDTHVHSSECSGCAKNNVRELVHAYKEAGFSGFVLTNHFYHGNTALSRDIAWEDFANAYYNAFLEAKAEGDKYGVDVIFGLEINKRFQKFFFDYSPKHASHFVAVEFCNCVFHLYFRHNTPQILINRLYRKIKSLKISSVEKRLGFFRAGSVFCLCKKSGRDCRGGVSRSLANDNPEKPGF